MSFNLIFKPYGERSILIEWPSIISKQILEDIIRFKTAIEEKNIEPIVELKSAYNSLLISYNSICRNFENEVKTLKKLYKTTNFQHDILSRTWKIPVCYDDIFGIDLDEMSKAKGLSKNEIIKRHSETKYTVYFIGFLPGFLYLGGLNESLFTPRKSTPRLEIEKGAVGIGGNQTGIYPSESPGGWNIIGNSPIPFFDVTKGIPCFAKPGDKITFQSITQKEHKGIKLLVDAGVYQIESEVIDG
ncbi:5-oxoprolinase subunit PxpB [Gaetbulibacter sp. M235]|uniref:5-oxoprolinase subunit PxpB n=1 Tax=Gaetbulibacter sp. M235 TaxID=3126510 RepID=UPI00374F1902